jgi:hypothetical protein
VGFPELSADTPDPTITVSNWIQLLSSPCMITV